MAKEIICPNCGMHFVSSDEQSSTPCTCTDDVSVVAVKTASQRRLEQLKAAGVDVSGYHALNIGGSDVLMHVTDGVPSIVTDDDPIFASIMASGAIPARELYRRWIPAKMLEALSYVSFDGTRKGYTEWLKNKGYEYQFGVIEGELEFRAACSRHHDKENFAAASRAFRKSVVRQFCEEHLANVIAFVDHLPVHKCHGKPYKKVKGFGKGVFVNEIEAKVYKPMRDAIAAIKRATTPGALCDAYKEFNKVRTSVVPFTTPLSRTFLCAYKLNGAYYTLRDLILFEGCTFRIDGEAMSKERSLEHLDELATTHSDNAEGYKLLGLLKEFLRYNDIDPVALRKEWHQRTIARRQSRD